VLRKLQVAAILSCMFSYAAAGTVSIGTVSARGDMRVDSYVVKGNATLFDGSVVETRQATADFRLDNGTEITMSTSSRGTLYRDRLVLQQGQSELAASGSFWLEANGLRVTPRERNSRGVVALKAGNTLEVAALNGSFGISRNGIPLASVRPGRVLSFAMQAGASPTSFSGAGIVSFENGRYYLTSDAGVKYEITCKDFHKYVGMKVDVTGTVQPAATQVEDVGPPICASLVAIHGSTGIGLGKLLLISGVIVGTGIGLGVGIYDASQPTSPPSI